MQRNLKLMAYLLASILLVAPLYMVRLQFFGLPANALLLWVVFVWLVFAAWLTSTKSWNGFFASLKTLDKKVLFLAGLFLLAGVFSLLKVGIDSASLGQFVVLYLQPVSVFVVAGYVSKSLPQTKTYTLNAVYCLVASAGLYAAMQYLTLAGLPPQYWGNSVEPKRAVGFFLHPNFYALFAAPLLAFALPHVGEKIKAWRADTKTLAAVCLWLLGAFGLGLSLSRAGWLGLAAATVAYAFVAADKKFRRLLLTAAVVLTVVVVSTPNLRYRLLLPFYGEKSAVSRLSLWTTGWKGIRESPLSGLGLTGFARSWDRLNTDAGLAEKHNFPHNIFLNFWVETGFLGLVSFLGLCGLFLYRGFKNKNNPWLLGVALFVLSLLVQGQIDNPYFKNDLAMVFWIILALAL